MIFVSNREDLVFDSLKTRPYGFIRKSHFRSDVAQVLAAFMKDLRSDHPHLLLLRSEEGQVALKIDSAAYLESQGKKQEIHVDGKKEPYVLRSTFKTFEDALEKEGFLPCYKGILVNYRYIRAIGDDIVLLKDGTSLPLSRRKAEETREKYMELRKKELTLVF